MEEAKVLNDEAKRLHISEEELTLLIEKARQQHAIKEDVSIMPLHLIAANPEHALEHFKVLVSQIRQLGIMTDRPKFDELAAQEGRMSAAERALWRQIQGQSPA